MNYHSTRSSFELVNSAQAVLTGLAPDGGLYMPEYIPHLDWHETLSGDSLYKLWKWTGDGLYLELVKDITLTIGQYMSTDEKPIYDWDTDPALRDAGDPALIEEHRMPRGFINERVNLSDWEDDRHIGGVFHGSCWSETSNLLALAEVIPLLADPQS